MALPYLAALPTLAARPAVVRRAVALAAGGIVVWLLVVPQLAKSGDALHSLGQADCWWPLLAVALEAGALIAYAQLTRSVLPRTSPAPALTTVLRVDLSTLALSHVVPAGSAAGVSLRFRLFTRLGISGTDAAFASAVQSLGSAVVLNGMLWVAIVVAIPLHGGNPLYATAATTGGVFLALLGSLVLALTRGEDATAHRLGAVLGKMPLLQAATVERIVHAFAARLRELSGDRLLLLRAMGWAAVNWLLDMAALWVLLAGLGHRVGLVGIMVCYGLANVLAAIPLTPGGLGVVEAALSTLLVGFSVPAETALFGVLCWRAVNFWLPIPVGGLAYASLCRSIRLTGCRELNSDSVAYCEVSAVGGPGVAVGGADDRSDTRAGGTGSNRTYSRHERVPHVLGRGHGWPAAAGDPCRRRQPDLAGTG